MEQLEDVVRLAQDHIDRENASNPAIQAIISIVGQFVGSHRVMCYGGTAINNLLSKENQFYDPSRDIPDYDFFSETPQLHAMELADTISNAGFKMVEVKPGMHIGTFKVFADFIGVADISFLEPTIFKRFWKDRVEKNGISYVPPNFLRMSVYLELSRPRGDVSRWVKVYSRIQKLNKEYPIVCPIQHEERTDAIIPPDIRKQLERLIINEKIILLGFNASTVQQRVGGRPPGEWKLPLDLLVEPSRRDHISALLKDVLSAYADVHIQKYKEFGELLPPYTDIIDTPSGVTAVRVYETSACHSYHQMANGLRVASIPTLLQFFLAMLYGDEHVREHLSEQRFVCTAQHLVEIANERGSRRYKLLTPIECMGTQETIVDIKLKKTLAYENALKKGRLSPEFLQSFFTYDPTKVTDKQREILRDKLKNLPEHHSL